MSVFAVEADCKRKNGHGRRRARQYGRITKPRQAAGLLGFVAEGYTVSVQPFYICTNLTLPTGALDSKSSEQLLTLFNEINCDGQTILMVTHSTKAASRANRVLFIKDGVVFHQIYKGSMTDDSMYTKISDTLTALATGGDNIE